MAAIASGIQIKAQRPGRAAFDADMLLNSAAPEFPESGTGDTPGIEDEATGQVCAAGVTGDGCAV